MSEFIIEKQENKLWRNIKAYKQYLDGLPAGRYKVKIENEDKRTNPQNSYLHGVLIPEFKSALRSVGYDGVKTNEQTKLILKKMFLTTTTINKETGEVLEYVRDTSDLTTKEMAALFDEVIKFTAENMHYEIPFPNEQTQIPL